MVALPVDATVRVDGDPGKNSHAPLVGVPAERLRCFHPTVAISKHAIDDDRRNAIAAREVDQSGVIREEPIGRFTVGVEDADLLHADLLQIPVG